MPRLPDRASRFALALLLLTPVLAFAGPVPEDEVAKSAAKIPARATAITPAYVPGQPVRFPKELKPLFMGEFDRDIAAPSDEDVQPFAPIGSTPTHPKQPPVFPNFAANDTAGDPPRATQSENSLAAHGRFLVAGWNDGFDRSTPRSFSGYGWSTDFGRTWTDGGTLPHGSATDVTNGDPSLVADSDGNFFYASLYRETPLSDLAVSVSRGRFQNGTFTFEPPVVAGRPGPGELDKEWIAADPDDGTLYLTWTRFLDRGNLIEMSRSRDHGRTWSAPVAVSDVASEAVQGSRPVVGPDHEVYVVYSVTDLSDFGSHFRVRRSDDRGRTFGPRADVGEAPGDEQVYTNFASGPPGFNRTSGVEFPSIAVSHHGRHRGTVYVVWPESVDWFDDLLGTAGVVSEVEGNNTPATATPITLGQAVTGAYATSTDADWFSFEGVAGQTVEFFLFPPQGGGGDGFLRMFCRNGDTPDRLAFSYFGGGQAFVVFTLPATGRYFVRATPINAQARAGAYVLATALHAPGPRDVVNDARDVVISSSRDGLHWTRRTRVNSEAPHFDNAFPEVAVDESGDVHVVWYDHRNDPFGIGTELFHAVSRDAGRSFAPETRVTDGPATNWSVAQSNLAPNMGDYIGLTADGGNVYAIWADGRQGTSDSWMARVAAGDDDDDHGEERGDDHRATALRAGAAPGALTLALANPLRAGAPAHVRFTLPVAGEATLSLYSVTGQHVRTLATGALEAGEHELAWDLRARGGETVAPGVYFSVLRQGREQRTQRFVVIP